MTQFANRMKNVSGSVIREVFKLMGDPALISFGGGNPSETSFAAEEIAQTLHRLLMEKGGVLLQYGVTEGYPPFREAAVRMINENGVSAEYDNVMTVSGSTQGIDLACRVLLDDGDVVLTESPVFLGAIQNFRLYNVNLVPIPADEEGIMTDALEELMQKHRPKMLYCIPTFQNPTGKTLGVERRKRIAFLADKYDVMVLEDDPYRDLRYEGEHLPSIKSFDESDHVILLNSFSKVISPGMRVGCVTAGKDVIRRMTIAKQSSDLHTNNLCQALVAECVTSGFLKAHIQTILHEYASRLYEMLRAIDAHFPKECRLFAPRAACSCGAIFRA